MSVSANRLELLQIDDALAAIAEALAAPHPSLRDTFSPPSGEKE